MKRAKTWVNGPMVWIGCARCEKFWSDFVARTFALIAPVQPILLRVLCSKEMIPNPPKHYKTHQNTSLGSDGVDRVDLLQKILTRLCGTNFCINCNSSACFEPSIIKRQNSPKCTQTQRNATTHEYWVQWGGSGAFIAKNSEATSWHDLLQYLHHTQPILHRVSCSNKMVPNAPKHFEI